MCWADQRGLLFSLLEHHIRRMRSEDISAAELERLLSLAEVVAPNGENQ